MMRLIMSECKKILKNKINLFLILAMVCGIGYVTYEEYHIKAHLPVNAGGESVEYKTLDGESITSIKELNTYANTVLSKYTNEKDLKATWEAYKKDYHQLYDELTETIDINVMKKCYGDEYSKIPKTGMISGGKDLYDNADLMYFDINGTSLSTYDETTDSAVLPVFYEKQAELNTLNYIYRNDTLASYISAVQHQGNPYLTDDNNKYNKTPLYYFANIDQLYQEIEAGVFNQMNIDHPTISEKDNKKIKEAVNSKVMNTNYTFGSTFEMEQFKYVLTKFTFFSLLLVAILLANSFAIENRTKLDQIITPSRTGMIKITTAKLIAGLGIAILCFLLQFLCMIVVSYLSLDLSGWSLSITSDVELATYTYSQYLFARLQMLTIAIIAIAMLTMFLSCIFKNQFICIVITILFILVPYLMASSIPINLAQLLPSSYTNYDFLTANGIYGIPYLVISGKIFMHKDLATIFWVIMSAVMAILMLGKARFHIVTNR